jgi:hypothetical protein
VLQIRECEAFLAIEDAGVDRKDGGIVFDGVEDVHGWSRRWWGHAAKDSEIHSRS